ncbi:hypothetical protein CJ030_MR3G019039 [Morella rubra]|uniref:CLAVATA3/ESR (CLE)-related protein 25 n=1 Tax=Morella rubra TaxID=262757 RepID=A0A6A1W5Y4_9ROSI|nr:hypothetical protein CJ030_MR3G019039 [Morella rubra]
MQVHQSLQVGTLLRKLMILAFLSLLVCGEGEAAMVVGVHSQSRNVQEKQQFKHLIRHSSDLYVSSKRKVPNASDPLHNR